MATILQIEKKANYGKSLSAFYNQAMNAIGILKGIKTNIANLKTEVEGDEDCDANDTAEVQAQIEALLSEIVKI